jgi:hypothetical protein
MDQNKFQTRLLDQAQNESVSAKPITCFCLARKCARVRSLSLPVSTENVILFIFHGVRHVWFTERNIPPIRTPGTLINNYRYQVAGDGQLGTAVRQILQRNVRYCTCCRCLTGMFEVFYVPNRHEPTQIMVSRERSLSSPPSCPL